MSYRRWPSGWVDQAMREVYRDELGALNSRPGAIVEVWNRRSPFGVAGYSSPEEWRRAQDQMAGNASSSPFDSDFARANAYGPALPLEPPARDFLAEARAELDALLPEGDGVLPEVPRRGWWERFRWWLVNRRRQAGQP